MIGREGPGPERPGPDYPPEWDLEPAEEQEPYADVPPGFYVTEDPDRGEVLLPVPPCTLCGRIPTVGEQHRALFAVGETGEDAEEVCVGPDRRQLAYAPLPDTEPTGTSTDPWSSPSNEPPPF